ncbi:hypothetical protein GF1_27950 [Desulfolithobacter dissulfuricans]|uniref:Uncharacterized protein n=1 Tax=Desulfolithobacter dissulfuricans TaxID=2795293 RepID=A0A915U358_9BACT|nr:hypothetical protein GF1_27950 [Desulfolithobacter dissulfuricans]
MVSVYLFLVNRGAIGKKACPVNSDPLVSGQAADYLHKIALVLSSGHLDLAGSIVHNLINNLPGRASDHSLGRNQQGMFVSVDDDRSVDGTSGPPPARIVNIDKNFHRPASWSYCRAYLIDSSFDQAAGSQG